MSTLARPLRDGFAALPARRQGLVAVTVSAVLWSTGGLFIKWVNLDAFGITFWRSILAAGTLAFFMRPPFVAPWRASGHVWALAVSYAVTLLLFVIATRLTTAANAIFLQYTAPIYLLVFGGFVLDEPPHRADVIATAAAFGGMGLFFLGRLEADAVAGNAAAIGSGMAFAAFLVLLRVPGCTVEARPQAMILGNGLLVVVCGAVLAVRGESAPLHPGAGDAAALVFLGIVQIGLAYVVFGYGIARVHALEAGLIGMLEPVLNPIWVFLVLGETPGWWAVVGGAIIVSAVAARTWYVEHERSGAPLAVPLVAPAAGE